MRMNLKTSAALITLAAFSAPMAGAALAQQPVAQQPRPQQPVPAGTIAPDQINIFGSVPADLTGLEEGPRVEGFISARRGSAMQVTGEGGTVTPIMISQQTSIRSTGGFLGLSRTSLAANDLVNGVPVTVETVRWDGGLIASSIRMRNGDLQTANMIRNGTAQRFGENELAIEENAAATEALRGRMASIDQYNLKSSTNAYFDTGRWQLSAADQRAICATAEEAKAIDNALILVVGYTDSVGDQDYNQTLSERRAARVVNHLQQQCGWAPYRMLTPTGMAEADPTADNTTAAGRAQNRRVSVNILVSKAVDNM